MPKADIHENFCAAKGEVWVSLFGEGGCVGFGATERVQSRPCKLPAANDARDFQFGHYLDEDAHPLPAAVDWSLKKTTGWGMMANGTVHDCTCAAAGHMIECWTSNGLVETSVSDEDVLRLYSALTGYEPRTGANDGGALLSKALEHWRKHGIGEHRIRAYAKLDHRRHRQLRAAVYLFGGAYVGLDLPRWAQAHDVWSLRAAPDVERENGNTADDDSFGHAVNVVGYDEQFVHFISWGGKRQMTWKFWDRYVDELFVVMAEEFLVDGRTPNGFDRARLEADLLRLGRTDGRSRRQFAEADLL